LDLAVAVKGFQSFGGQDGYVIPVAVLHRLLDVIDGSGKSANPVRPNALIMAPRYSDPGSIPEISSYQVAKVGHYGQGLPPVMLNFEYLKLRWLRPVQ
jgi:hypothetical protein